MAAPDSGPTSLKFTDDDVLQCFREEHRRQVGKIELSAKEVTEILNQRVLDEKEVTRQAVKKRLDEMEGEQLTKNQHGRSHLYARSEDIDRLFREPEPLSTSPPPASGPGDPPETEDDETNGEDIDVEIPQNQTLSTWSERLRILAITLTFGAFAGAAVLFAVYTTGLVTLSVVSASIWMIGFAALAAIGVVSAGVSALLAAFAEIAPTVESTPPTTSVGENA